MTLPVTHIGSRSLFPSLGSTIYLNHAAISPPSLATQHAVRDVLEDFATKGSDAFLDTVEARLNLKQEMASLLNAPSSDGSDLAWCPNTSSGIQAIAHAFPWKQGDHIILFNGEFPANIIPWLQAAERHHLQINWCSLEPLFSNEGADWSSIEAVLRRGVRLVAMSAVQFQTGLRIPLDELATLCHHYGCALFVDGIQACGSTPLPLSQIDFMACGGHKWMMGVEGGGFLYIHPHWREKLTPQASWLSVEEPLDFLFSKHSCLRYDKSLRRDPSAFESGAQSAIAYAALTASVSLLKQFGIETIYHHIQSLIDPLEEGLLELGFQSIRCPDQSRRSTILSVKPPLTHECDLTTWCRKLSERGITTSTPDGWLRFSPHWPNDIEQIKHVLEELKSLR